MSPPRFLNTRSVYISVLVATVSLVALLVVAESGQLRLRNATSAITLSQWRQAALAEFLRSMGDAESAQRGFFLTEKSRYLLGFDPAVRRMTSILDRLGSSYAREAPGPGASPDDRGYSDARALRMLAGEKIGEMNSTLRLYGESGRYAAIALVETDVGNKTGAEIRALVQRLRTLEIRNLDNKLVAWRRDVLLGRRLIAAGTLLNILLLLVAGILLARDLKRRENFSAELSARNEELDAQVKARTQSLSELSSHLQKVGEVEKAALARELHDELGGLLIATKMDLVWLRRRLDNGEPLLNERWDRVFGSLDEGVDFKRRIIESLRPTLLDNMGLVPALRWLTAECCRRAGLSCQEHYPDELPDLGPEANIALFRAAQECWTNIMKHAQASSVEIDLVHDDSMLYLTIRDDGIGIDPERIDKARSHGLASMNHRLAALSGTLKVARAPSGRGTVVEVILPIPRPES